MALVATPQPMASTRWRRLIPIAFVTYSFAYLDRSNYSLGAAGGLKTALHISSGESGLLGGLFFLGYFFFQVPAATFAERRNVRTLMCWSLAIWGVLAAAQGVISTYSLLLIDRFLLGVVEAVVIPAMLVFLSHWFTKAERGRADTFLILGNPVTLLWMSVVSGYLIAATSYRWMFVIEGLPAIAWAVAFYLLVDDRPRDASWLPEGERSRVEQALAEEQAGLPAARPLTQVLRSRNVLVLSAQYLFWSIGVYGLVFWLPTIVKNLSGRGIGTTGALTAIPYAVAVVFMLVGSAASDRSGRRRTFVWPFLLLAAAAFFLSFAFRGSSFLLSFILLIVAAGGMYAPYGPYFAAVPELLPASDAAPAVGMINAFGGLGGFLGTYIVGWLGGGTAASFLFLSASLLVAALLMFLVGGQRAAVPEESEAYPTDTRAEVGLGRAHA
jgi:sugar phosphate permease